MHIAVKLKSFLLRPSIVLPLGAYLPAPSDDANDFWERPTWLLDDVPGASGINVMQTLCTSDIEVDDEENEEEEEN